jgi:hypothetical protein
MTTPSRRSLSGAAAFVAGLAVCLGAALTIGVSSVATSAVGPDQVIADASAYYVLAMKEDRFYNWDFHCGNATTCISRTNVDWPLTTLFYNNAEINLVKDNYLAGVYRYGNTCASAQYTSMNDGQGANWDTDGGRKTICCPGSYDTAFHFRIYSAGTQYGNHDRMYNTKWGFWIVASTHTDRNEPLCFPFYGVGASYGNNDKAQAFLYDIWVRVLHKVGFSNYYDFYNAQSADFGNHHLRSDGLADLLKVA